MPDHLLFQICLFAISLFILMKGADWLIDSSSALARKLNISELIIGLTVVAFGTSLPEFVVSVQAALQGSPELAYSNVVGSNIANLLLILGTTAIILPLSANQEVRSNLRLFWGLVIAFAAVLVFGKTDSIENILFSSQINRLGGLVLLAFFLAFVVKIFRQTKAGSPPEGIEGGADDDVDVSKGILWLLAGTAMIILGGEFTVQSAVAIAKNLGVPESTIGLTIVAFGTSLPELVASLSAAGKGKGDMIIGNILGSNLMNLALVLGTAAMVSPMDVDQWGVFDMFVHTGVSLLFLTLMSRKGTKTHLSRQAGIGFLILYVSYMTLIGVRDFIR